MFDSDEGSDDALIAEMRRGLAKRRGYADSRTWPLDRSLEEYGIVQDFVQAVALAGEAGAPFTDLRQHPRGEDPPDFEARDTSGRRMAIELTELVDRRAVEKAARGVRAVPVEWTAVALTAALAERLARKDFRHRLHGGPYDEYVVVIHTGEYLLDEQQVRGWLRDHRFTPPKGIDRAYLSLDYHPGREYPLVRLRW